MPRDLCLTCGNAGVVIEWRLVWKEFREGRGLVQCAVRVASEEVGRHLAANAPETAVDVELQSGARACPRLRRARPQEPEEPVNAALPRMWWMES